MQRMDTILLKHLHIQPLLSSRLAEEEYERVQGKVLRARGYLPVNSQVVREPSQFRRVRRRRIDIAEEYEKPQRPVQIGLLRLDRKASPTYRRPELVQQAGVGFAQRGEGHAVLGTRLLTSA